MTISVLIADDQAMVRAGFAAVLAAQPGIEVVGQAADGAEAVSLARDLRPDVVVMDVRMPGLNGIEATRALQTPPRSSDYVPRVLMLTTFDIDEYVYEALRAGASGFLLKDATPEELVAAVRIVAGGDALLAPSVTRRLIEDFARSGPPPRTDSAPPRRAHRARAGGAHARGPGHVELRDRRGPLHRRADGEDARQQDPAEARAPRSRARRRARVRHGPRPARRVVPSALPAAEERYPGRGRNGTAGLMRAGAPRP